MLGRDFPCVFGRFLCKLKNTFAFREDHFANLLNMSAKHSVFRGISIATIHRQLRKEETYDEPNENNCIPLLTHNECRVLCCHCTGAAGCE